MREVVSDDGHQQSMVDSNLLVDKWADTAWKGGALSEAYQWFRTGLSAQEFGEPEMIFKKFFNKFFCKLIKLLFCCVYCYANHSTQKVFYYFTHQHCLILCLALKT